MKLKSIAVALSLLAGVSAASAMTTLNAGPYSVNYDETTSFGTLSSWFSSGSSYGFSWTVPSSVQVLNFGAGAVASFNLPSFTLTPNAGWALSGGVQVFIGNLVYTEVGGASTSLVASADLSVNGGAALPVAGLVPRNTTASAVDFESGYYGGSASAPIGGFSSLDVSNAKIKLSATGLGFSSIIAQPQNKLEYSFTATPVPEPETYAMMLAGLVALGFLARRRGAI